jgi:inorganic pyrophosphatase
MIVEATIEIPMGTQNKYEVDPKTHRIKLDRVLYSSVSYPSEYGFIENTLSGDGDPLDILVLTTFPTFPGCIIKSKVLGYLELIDNGFTDEKVIAINSTDPRYEHIKSIEDLPEHTIDEIKEFFKTYKHLQGIKVQVGKIYGLDETIKLIEECKKRFVE